MAEILQICALLNDVSMTEVIKATSMKNELWQCRMKNHNLLGVIYF